MIEHEMFLMKNKIIKLVIWLISKEEYDNLLTKKERNTM